MAAHPRISVVIPTYNRAELLRAALQSVLAQTYPAAQIVVVDDGSTDHTAEVVRGLAVGGERVAYLQEPHLDRLGDARNRGVRASDGEWVAFLDSDDLWRPERLERQIGSIDMNPSARFAFCNVQRFNEDGPFESGPYLSPSADYNGRILGALLEEPVVVPSALMVRRDAFEEMGGFSDRLINEDYELIVELAARYEASYVPEPLVLMRAHEVSRSRARHESAMLEYIDIVGGFLRRHPDRPLEERVRGRRGLANVHVKLARFYIETGDGSAARRHLRALLRLRPWDRRALPAYLVSWRRGTR